MYSASIVDNDTIGCFFDNHENALERWVKLVMERISTVHFNIVHDGMELGQTLPQRGFR